MITRASAAIRNNRGFTLVEVLTVAGASSLIVVVGLAMMIATMRCYDRCTARTYSDSDAIIAMQMIVSDVREAKSYKLLANGERLRVVMPETTEQGYYDNRNADTAHQFDFYLSDSTGVPGHSGTYLWKGKDNNSRTLLLKRNIKSLSFVEDTDKSIEITIVATNNTAAEPMDTSLTQRVVYLRNFRK